MKKIKYIHILWRNEIKFNANIVKFINDYENGFNKKEHLFVTPHQFVYDSLCEFDNVVLDKSRKNLFNKYGCRCDLIISHSTMNLQSVLGIRRKYEKKILLRSWGGAMGCRYRKKQPIRNLLKKFVNAAYSKKISSFAAIGIANIVDILALRDLFPKMKFYRMPYPAKGGYENLCKIRDSKAEKDNKLNVLIGHRGTYEGNHIEVIKKLKRFGEKIHIHIPLSYGNDEYIASVKKYVEGCGMKNITIIDQFMQKEEYASVLNKMDIGIFAGENSYALGNIAILLFLRKKIFLNSKGIIKKAFDEENIPYDLIDKIDSLDFEAFAKPVTYTETTGINLMSRSMDEMIESWKIILKDFD